MQTPPGPSGLYDPRFEHDSCGVSFVAHIKGVASHDLVTHGTRGADQPRPPWCHRRRAGHGRRRWHPRPGPRPLPARGAPRRTGCRPARRPARTPSASASYPTDVLAAEKARAAIETIAADESLDVVAWRDVPVDPSCLGATARAVMPAFAQVFITDPAGATGIELDRKVYLARKRIEHELEPEIATYFASLSSRTLVYKGMLTTPQLAQFFPDLHDERFESALLLIHSRFSTNTFPSWPLAHPYRFIAHNGEINTVQGNQNWMRAREAMLDGSVFPGIDRAFPICTPGASDTARFDEVLELLHLGGRPDPPRRADDDPRGVGEQRRAGPRPPGLLPLPLVRDGAVGRSRQRGLHRRHGDRRRARPQRLAAEPLLGHRRRHRRDGVRGRGHRHRPGQGDHEGSPPAGAHVPHRHGRGPDRRRRGDQDDARRRAPLRRVAGGEPRRARRPAAA